MTEDMFERIMDAGAELYEQIKPILEKHGLTDECAPSVLSVCVGAIMKLSDATAGNIITGAELMQRHWSSSPKSPHAFSAVFDAPHRS